MVTGKSASCPNFFGGQIKLPAGIQCERTKPLWATNRIYRLLFPWLKVLICWETVGFIFCEWQRSREESCMFCQVQFSRNMIRKINEQSHWTILGFSPPLSFFWLRRHGIHDFHKLCPEWSVHWQESRHKARFWGCAVCRVTCPSSTYIQGETTPASQSPRSYGVQLCKHGVSNKTAKMARLTRDRLLSKLSKPWSSDGVVIFSWTD